VGRRVGGSADGLAGRERTAGPPDRRSELPAMIGDDLWSDVDGAQKAGLQGWLVRTGKFRPDVFERSGVRPDRVLDSIANLCS
jgi:ribonucleotide monophosphatase NagD (HAD superfamily)